MKTIVPFQPLSTKDEDCRVVHFIQTLRQLVTHDKHFWGIDEIETTLIGLIVWTMESFSLLYFKFRVVKIICEYYTQI